MNILRSICAASLLFLGLMACDKNTPKQAPPNSLNAPETQAPKRDENKPITNKNTAFKAYNVNALQQARITAIALNKTIEQLLAEPNQQNLALTHAAWWDAQEKYSAFLPFTLLSHTHNNLSASFNSELNKLHQRAAAEPIQPGFLDAYGAYLFSGIVNDISLNITVDTLKKQHQMTSQEDVALGLYAIEFMLFGDEGLRTIIDYKQNISLNKAQIKRGFKKVEETPNNRRRHLLRVQSQTLIETIDALTTLLNNQHDQPETINVVHALSQKIKKARSLLTALSKTTDFEDYNALKLRKKTLNTLNGLQGALTLLPFENKEQIMTHLASIKDKMTVQKQQDAIEALDSAQKLIRF